MKIFKVLVRLWARMVTLPLLLLYFSASETTKSLIKSDVDEMNKRCEIKESLYYYLFFHQPYRNMYYFRLGKPSYWVKWYLRPYPLFFIRQGMESFGARAFVLNHPYSTIIYAKSIGSNFTCSHLCTIGKARLGDGNSVPTIGDNVYVGANSTVLGDIHVGNNVIIGANSVVVKDVPDNCIVVGNPAKIVKQLSPNTNG